MTYGFYVLLLAVFAVNIDIMTLSNDDNTSTTTLELINNIIVQEDAVATLDNISRGPGYYWYIEYTLNGNTYVSCPPDGSTCIKW